ncbi:hypothetical protein BKA65DRAFT_479536 [Rhexocercosporidium sp. MPI-PUGE-AT-0058]|nr:hypothetical protein BKA65DRAFT_479536 [Rhexocercosporidium sp. MPI-PUGE-AT-0058]
MSNTVVINLTEDEVAEESNNDFMQHVREINDREIFSYQDALQYLKTFNPTGLINSPLLKPYIVEAKAILSRGPNDPQAYTAIEWVSAFSAIIEEDPDWITYENPEHQFTYMLCCTNKHSGHVFLKLKTPLMLPKSGKKMTTPWSNTNINTTATAGPSISRTAPNYGIPSHGALSEYDSGYDSVDEMAHNYQIPQPATRAPPCTFYGSEFNHTRSTTSFSTLWTPDYIPNNPYVQTAGIFYHPNGAEFAPMSRTSRTAKSFMQAKASFQRPASTEKTFNDSQPDCNTMMESKKRVTRWMQIINLPALSEWDAHDRSTNYQFSVEGDIQAQETAWITARNRYDECTIGQRRQQWLASLRNPPTSRTSANGNKYLVHHY